MLKAVVLPASERLGCLACYNNRCCSPTSAHIGCHPAAPGEPLPEALAKLDPQLIENVCNDVMDSGGQLGELMQHAFGSS